MASCLPVEQWCTPLIPELGGQRQEHLCDFETILVYIARLCLKNKTNKTQVGARFLGRSHMMPWCLVPHQLLEPCPAFLSQ